MEKAKFKTRNFISILLGIIFITTAISSIINFFTPYSKRFSEFHIFFGSVFVILAGFHLIINFKSLLVYIKKRKSDNNNNREFIMALIISSVFFIGFLGNIIPPISTFLDLNDLIKTKQKDVNFKEIITMNMEKEGKPFEITFYKGRNYAHIVRRPFRNVILIPQIAIWIESLDGDYIETLYVTQRAGKSNWWSMPFASEPVNRKAALPAWSHKRAIESEGYVMPTISNPLVDSITSATPMGNFVLKTKIDPDNTRFRIFVELNKSWDYNDFYTPERLEEDLTLSHARRSYSGQPAVVYSGVINSENNSAIEVLELSGHSDPKGETGEINSDISHLDSALEIIDLITISY